jgi:uncharacterized protein YxjI
MTKTEIKFLMNLKKRGKTYNEIALEFAKKFGVKKSPSALEATFRRHRNDYDLDGLRSHVEIKAEVMEERILEAFLDLVSKRKYVPIQGEFSNSTGYSLEQVKRYYGSFENLESKARELDSKVFAYIIDETRFSEEVFKELREDISKHNRFVITTAVTGCQPHEDGLAALQNYCKRNNAKLLILPCSDPATSKDRKYAFSLDHKLPMDAVVFRDVALNSNIFLSTIKLSAKQINPLTGLKRLAKHGTCVLASPKQMLEHVAMSNKKNLPRALMTTGSITKSDYSTDMYMSERTAYIADDDHKLGAVIVEIKDAKIFFYRRVEIDPKTGAFCDINKKYLADGSMHYVSAELVQQPDWHVLSTDPKFKKAAKEVVSAVKPEWMTLEDFFDGITINPHEKNNIAVRAMKVLRGEFRLSEELRACSKEIDDLASWDAKKLVFKYGNHEDFLLRWLSTAEYKDDPVNHYEGVCLAKALLEGEMPFEHAMRVRYPFKAQDRVKFLGVNDSFKVNDIENGVHGHLGAGGKRNPGMVGLEAYGPVNVGHNHSAAILREVVRVGTATHLQLSYNDGASAWTQTLNIQHRDGARQLITVMNGEWCLADILEN